MSKNVSGTVDLGNGYLLTIGEGGAWVIWGAKKVPVDESMWQGNPQERQAIIDQAAANAVAVAQKQKKKNRTGDLLLVIGIFTILFVFGLVLIVVGAVMRSKSWKQLKLIKASGLVPKEALKS